VGRHLSRVALALPVGAFLLASNGPAQLPDPPIRPASSSVWVRPERLPASAVPIRIEAAEEGNHTVLGLIVGGGLGLIAGYGFYNAMCEAVDNNCSGSRLPYLVVGTGIGAGLGALIGSVAD
jgi:hypothetical protein